MLTVMLLAAATVQGPPEQHVRTTEPRIAALIESGASLSPTFRRLVAALDASDVIVYVEPKQTRSRLGGYLAHHVVASGGYRYLRIAIEAGGPERRAIPLLAHELQHALEVALVPEARDAERIERLFIGQNAGCGSTCYETLAALEVQRMVALELKPGSGSPGPVFMAATVE